MKAILILVIVFLTGCTATSTNFSANRYYQQVGTNIKFGENQNVGINVGTNGISINGYSYK